MHKNKQGNVLLLLTKTVDTSEEQGSYMDYSKTNISKM